MVDRPRWCDEQVGWPGGLWQTRAVEQRTRAVDLVIVDGDPLADVADALNVVGIVRNGRFYSTISLIEHIEKIRIVE